MHTNQTGRLIGAVFGLVFVLANAGALPTAAAIPLRVLAILVFLRLFTAMRRAGATADGTTTRLTFGRGYRLVVGAEVVVGLGGLFVLARVLHVPQAAIGWIALVVGLHFFGLAVVWRMPSVHVMAAGLTACGAAGLALARADAPHAAVATVAGIAPGVLLLSAVAWTLKASKPAVAAAGRP
ncbi:hypothetical protein AB0442_41015 [Kitasatospora sp. NPDC085895]|uniref:hypothetical protein n=1 Tax=Kitasatospora sp. NPDC085895 TaxID=3155057 RepID=UPI00345000E5